MSGLQEPSTLRRLPYPPPPPPSFPYGNGHHLFSVLVKKVMYSNLACILMELLQKKHGTNS